MILVDPRVGSAFTKTQGRRVDIIRLLNERVNGVAQLAVPQLEAGDFAFEGCGPDGVLDIGIERKELGDMLGSMRSGRYAGPDGQAPKMSQRYDVCYLIVEGVWRPSQDGILEVLSRGGWKPKALAAKGPQSRHFFMYAELDKHLCTMECVKNVVVVRSSSVYETIQQITNRYLWWQKPWDKHQSGDPIKTQSQVKYIEDTPVRAVASRIPSIGHKGAGMADRHWGTVEEMVNALSSEWREAGFGEKTAAKAYGWFRGR